VTTSLARRFAIFVVVAVAALWAAETGGPSAVHAGDVPFDAYPAKNPLSGDQDSIDKGAFLFGKWCTQCHGMKADGESRFGKYAYDLRKFWRGYCNFVVLVMNGRPKKQMPAWGGILTEEEVAKIGAFLETIRNEKANWEGTCNL